MRCADDGRDITLHVTCLNACEVVSVCVWWAFNCQWSGYLTVFKRLYFSRWKTCMNPGEVGPLHRSKSTAVMIGAFLSVDFMRAPLTWLPDSFQVAFLFCFFGRHLIPQMRLDNTFYFFGWRNLRQTTETVPPFLGKCPKQRKEKKKKNLEKCTESQKLREMSDTVKVDRKANDKEEEGKPKYVPTSWYCLKWGSW